MCHSREVHVRMDAEGGVVSHPPRHTWGPQVPAEAGRIFPENSQSGRGPATPGFQTSNFQNWEGIDSCHLKPLSAVSGYSAPRTLSSGEELCCVLGR